MNNQDESTARGRRQSQRESQEPNRHWGLRWAALGVGSVVLGVVMANTHEVGPSATLSATTIPPATEMQRVALALPVLSGSIAPIVETKDAGSPYDWRELTVESGDTLAALLNDLGIGYAVVHALATAGAAGEQLSRLRPGDELRLGFDPTTDALQRLVLARSVSRRLVFERQGEGDAFSGRVIKANLQRRLQYAHGVIETSLFAAAADLPDRLIMDLVNIFRWDIDFVYNIREGDRFTLVYEAFYRDGERVSTGNIITAEFINQGQVYRAVRYVNPKGEVGYFAPDGTSMRKTFLRTPVDFTRISSRYGKRYHPILHTMRMHDGIDYAAPRGSPIHVTGDGRIIFRGRNGGYGNMVVVRHANRYTTAYGHMSRFAPGQSVGTWVSQGEVIGYVGSTGLSTGPHVHYEFRINGKHTDPLAVEFPSVDPVPDADRDHFEQQIAPRLAKLGTLHRAYANLD